jgi:hypothetical protein
MANYGLVVEIAETDEPNQCCTLLIAALEVSRIGCG